MTNIVITTLSPFENRGVEALAISNIEGLRRVFDDARITVLTQQVEVARASLAPYDVLVCLDQARAPRRGLRKALFRPRRWVRQKALGWLNPSEKALATADLVVVSGGDVYSSVYGSLERHLRQLDLPLSLGIPVFFLGQSIGPFATMDEIKSFLGVANRCRVTVREPISFDYLTTTLGMTPDQVELTADPAFLLDVNDAVRSAIHAEYGLVPGAYCAMAVSRGISTFKGLPHGAHLEACVRAARFLIEKTGKVVLVPHVQLSRTDKENDLLLAQEIRAALGDDPACVVMGNRLHGAVEFKAALGSAAFVVAERTHGAIGAMSLGVPTLSIGYSIKAEGVLRQLIKDEAVFARSLLPITEFGPDNAVDVVRGAWEVRDAFAAELARHLPEAKARAARNFDIAHEMVAR
jgi:colanic acid/amylovoran biosynthesis protein